MDGVSASVAGLMGASPTTSPDKSSLMSAGADFSALLTRAVQTEAAPRAIAASRAGLASSNGGQNPGAKTLNTDLPATDIALFGLSFQQAANPAALTTSGNSAATVAAAQTGTPPLAAQPGSNVAANLSSAIASTTSAQGSATPSAQTAIDGQAPPASNAAAPATPNLTTATTNLASGTVQTSTDANPSTQTTASSSLASAPTASPDTSVIKATATPSTSTPNAAANLTAQNTPALSNAPATADQQSASPQTGTTNANGTAQAAATTAQPGSQQVLAQNGTIVQSAQMIQNPATQNQPTQNVPTRSRQSAAQSGIAATSSTAANTGSGTTAQTANGTASPASAPVNTTTAGSTGNAATSAASSNLQTLAELAPENINIPTTEDLSSDLPELDASDTIRDTLQQASSAARGHNASVLPHMRGAPTAATQAWSGIIQRFDGRAQQFEMRLDPAELGRVDVKIEITKDNTARIMMMVTNTDAMSELSRSVKALEQALSDSGIDLQEGGLNVELSQNESGSFTFSRDSDDNEDVNHSSTAQNAAQQDTDDSPAERVITPQLSIWSRHGVNLKA